MGWNGGVRKGTRRSVGAAGLIVCLVGVCALVLLGRSAQAAPDQFATEVLVDSPIGYWRLSELGGTTAADSSGNGNHGTYSGGIELGEPGLGGGDTAVRFFQDVDLGQGRVVVPNGATLNPSYITMEALVSWFGPTGDPELPVLQRILEKSFNFDENQALYALIIRSDTGRVQVELRTGSLFPDCVAMVTSDAAVTPNMATHLAATYDGSTIQIYINGDLDTDVAAPCSPGPLQSSTNDLGIGNQVKLTRPRLFNGIIDEVALYGTALSPERIQTHYTAIFSNEAPFFDPIDDQEVAEDAGPQSIMITGISAGVESEQTVTLTATSDNPTLIPHPVVSEVSADGQATLTYQPVADANGTATITVTADDGFATFSQTFDITVNAVNDPPFFLPIPDQFPTLAVEPQDVVITGVSAGPANEVEGEGGQTVTLTATSDNPTLIPHPTVSEVAADGQATLTYQPVAVDAKGTAMIAVTASDGIDTFSRTFSITLGAEPVTAAVTGFTPAGGPCVTETGPALGPCVTVTLTFTPTDFDGDGKVDPYFGFPPTPYNVFPTNADKIPEGPPISIPRDLVQIFRTSQTFSTVIDLGQWTTAPGGQYDFTYVNLVRDPELDGEGDCLPDATCFTPIWTGIKPVGSLTVTAGAKVADKNTVTLQTVELATKNSTFMPAGFVRARVYDRNDSGFQSTYGGKNPSGSLYGQIFEADIGLIAQCTTDDSGICYATEAATGDYLVIIRFDDLTNNQRVYSGLPKSPSDFRNGVATKDFIIIKKMLNGQFLEYQQDSKTVVCTPGSDCPS